MNVELGQTYRDTVTGLTGVAISRHEYLSGCMRICLQPRELKDGKPVEASTFDVQQLAEVQAEPVGVSKRAAGGPGEIPKPREVPQR